MYRTILPLRARYEVAHMVAVRTRTAQPAGLTLWVSDRDASRSLACNRTQGRHGSQGRSRTPPAGRCPCGEYGPESSAGRRCLSAKGPLLVSGLHVCEGLEPCRRPVVAHSHVQVEFLVRILHPI